ncbi:MAG: GTPase [Gammaproteobacteria bacterium]|nr:GTPase [Gammaproteobacteria bacterium]
MTRDRIAGEVRHGDQRFLLVDTGGLGAEAAEDEVLAGHVTAHSLQAIEEADLVLWLVDYRTGLTIGEQTLAEKLRSLGNRLRVVVNKTEGETAAIRRRRILMPSASASPSASRPSAAVASRSYSPKSWRHCRPNPCRYRQRRRRILPLPCLAGRMPANQLSSTACSARNAC